MKKIFIFILLFSIAFLYGCNSNENIFDFLNRKLVVEPLIEDGLFYVFPPADTGVTAILDDEVDQPFGITDIIINGEKYTDVQTDASKQAKTVKAIANYSEEFTFYEFESDSGVYVIADNVNLQIFVKPEDKETFLLYYEDLSNYNFNCLDDKNNLAGANLDNEMMKKLIQENEWVHSGDNYNLSEYEALKDYNTVPLRDCDGVYSITAHSKDWLVDRYYQSYIYEKNGVFYSSLYGEQDEEYPAQAVELTEEYQEYFKNLLQG